MGMGAAAEHMKLLVHAAAERALGQHALHREFDGALGVLLQELAERDALQVADVAGVLVIPLVGELGAGDAHRAGIDDHDVVAEILMRRIVGLVLALQAMSDLGGQTAQGFARRVDQVPVATGFFRLGEYGLHGKYSSLHAQTKGARVYRTPGPVTSPVVRTGLYNIMCA